MTILNTAYFRGSQRQEIQKGKVGLAADDVEFLETVFICV